jgi:hypothetical protein
MSNLGVLSALRSLGHTLAALTTNSADFKRAWAQAENDGRAGGGIAGRWAGEWISEENGHRGALRCALVRLDGGRYRASFHARYAKWLRVCYSIELHASSAGERMQLEGDADLGRLAGGLYHYEGETDGRHWACTYHCRYDHGRFSLAKTNTVPAAAAQGRSPTGTEKPAGPV